MTDPTFFKPHALSKAPIVREGRITRDLTMEPLDWDALESPAYERLPSRSECAREFRDERYGRVA
jgi:hypothetical protein